MNNYEGNVLKNEEPLDNLEWLVDIQNREQNFYFADLIVGGFYSG